MSAREFFSASLRKMGCHKDSKARPNGSAGRALRKNATHFFTLPAGRQVRDFGPLWQNIFRSEAEKNFLIVTCKELKFILMSASP